MADVRAPITGVVWQILVGEGDAIAVDQTVIVLESMKLEIRSEEHTSELQSH